MEEVGRMEAEEKLVERVARAIFASQDWPEFHPSFERTKEVFTTAARAAIKAVREVKG